MTINAVCSSGTLPDDLKLRNYTALVTGDDGPRATVKLEGAEFALNSSGVGSSFSGRIVDDTFVATLLSPFDTYYNYYYHSKPYPQVVERLSGSTFLVVYGMLTVKVEGSDLASGSLQGTLVVMAGASAPATATATCSGGPHQFSFARIR